VSNTGHGLPGRETDRTMKRMRINMDNSTPVETDEQLQPRPGTPFERPTRGPHAQKYDRQPETSYRPMLLKPVGADEAEALICDPQWFIQQKADGVRAIVTVNHIEHTVGAASRTGQAVALNVAIITALKDVFPDGAVLDAESCGGTLVIFDVLRMGTRDLSGCSCEQRLRELDNIARGNRHSHLFFIQTALTERQKRNAVTLLRQGGAEGVVFKDRRAPYSAGRPHAGGPALKWKFTASASVVVAGHHSEGKRSVQIALSDGARVGHVAIPGWHGALPVVGTVIEVAYLYAFRGGSLAQAVYKGIRSDVEADGAEKLQYKGEAR
jgi:bifunctional non-homologous end joining protein LigD